jgi:Holliday junction resolvase
MLGTQNNMVNRQKQKGSAWERDFVDLINENINGALAKRIPGSGALGTTLGEPGLNSDVVIRIPGFTKKFRVECKVRSGGKMLTIEKEWFDKIKKEAEEDFSTPLVACKYLGARKSDGIQSFVALDFYTFCGIINELVDLKRELDLCYEGKK